MKNDPRLAINGGPKTKTTEFTRKQRFADHELTYLQQALEQNTLFYGFGQFVKRACALMTDYTGRKYCVACTSGSAAVHLGLIGCGIGPGDEVIVTPNTDHGSVMGILTEGAVPVFCDCTDTLQASVDTIAAKITNRTKAVEVVHLAGYPAPVDEIVDFCRDRGIAVLEDCAQAWGTKLHGRRVGTFGTVGTFSTNDYKHISTGDGGFVVVDDEDLYRRIFNYADKYYDRFFDGAQRQAHQGMNYRLSELQGAVAVAQLEKVDAITAEYHRVGTSLEEQLQDLPGARLLAGIPGSYSTYWWTALIVNDECLADRDWLVTALQAEGVPANSYGKYDLIQKPLFQDRVARPWLEGDLQRQPFLQPDGREYVYSIADTPQHQHLLNAGIQLATNGSYSDQDVNEMAAGIRKVFIALAGA